VTRHSQDTHDDFLRYLRERFGCGGRLRILIVAGHPDDEIIGVGGALTSLRDAWIVHVTDGAPRKLDGLRLGFDGRSAYAARRRAEAHAALEIAGIGSDRIFELGFIDQESAFHLVELTQRLLDLLLDIRPDLVFVHPYEGGHPDHDAAAFATHTAIMKLDAAQVSAPKLIEFTSYHAGAEGIETGCFRGGSEYALRLSGFAREQKARMFACHRSQRDVLAAFPLDAELFRAAPRYNFSMLPLPLYYERFDWGMTGERWLELTRAAGKAFVLNLVETARD
jgi:LmbE family N-acetylglucosaminyl deacetylase